MDFHELQSKKTLTEQDWDDELGELSDEFPHNWAILTDKGYQGAMELKRVVHPKKKPVNGELSRSDVQRNTKVSSYRILVESYFGRLCSLWQVISCKWKWWERNYDNYFKLCVALTNTHVRWSPPREVDLDHYRRVRMRSYEIDVGGARKRHLSHQRYRDRRRARIDVNN